MGEQTALAYDPQDFERLLVSRENVGDVDGKPASFRSPSSRPFKPLPRPPDGQLLSVCSTKCNNAQHPRTRSARETRDAAPWYCLENRA